MSEQPVVLIAGGASGIGEAAARLFARSSYHVIVADRSVDLGEQLVAGLRDQEFSASFLPVDIADPASVQHCVDAAVAVYGILHYGINCAGIGGPTVPAHTVPTKGWKAVLDIDAAGAFYFTQSLVRYFRTVTPRVVRQADAEWNLPAVEERGAIVNIASVNGSIALKNMVGLVAAKHAVVGLPKVFAHENVDLGIRVNALSPGVVFSPILGAPDFDFANARDLYVQAQAFRRFAHPEEIAPALMFLCSDEASFCTGTDMKVDAGWSCH